MVSSSLRICASIISSTAGEIFLGRPLPGALAKELVLAYLFKNFAMPCRRCRVVWRPSSAKASVMPCRKSAVAVNNCAAL